MKPNLFKISLFLITLAISGITSTVLGQKSPATDIALTNLMEGNFKQAKNISTDAINANSKDALAYDIRGWTFLEDAKLADAQRDFEKAIALDPNNGVFYATLALCYKSPEKTELAKANAQKAISLLSTANKALEYYALGKAYEILKANDASTTAITKAIELNPRFALAYRRRGWMYADNKQYNLAIADFTKAIDINPALRNIYLGRGFAYYNQNQHDLALPDFNKAIELEPKNDDAYLFRGYIYYYKKQSDLALADFNKAIEFAPQNIYALFYRGYIYENNKQLDLALADYTKAGEIDPKNPEVFLDIGNICYQKQQFAQAITNYNKAIDLAPKYASAYINRAGAYDNIGNAKQANLDRKKYSELGGQITASAGNTMKAIYPQSVFDVQLARDALGRGLSSIVGEAKSYVDGRIFQAAGVRVVLFPVTPYLEEWYALRKKKEDKSTNVFMCDDANKCSVTAVADNQGRFVFEGLKPGHYFIQVIHNFTQLKTGRNYTGSNNSMEGSTMVTTNYYQDYDYTIARSARLEKFIEIKTDGEVKKITVKNGGIF